MRFTAARRRKLLLLQQEPVALDTLSQALVQAGRRGDELLPLALAAIDQRRALSAGLVVGLLLGLLVGVSLSSYFFW